MCSYEKAGWLGYQAHMKRPFEMLSNNEKYIWHFCNSYVLVFHVLHHIHHHHELVIVCCCCSCCASACFNCFTLLLSHCLLFSNLCLYSISWSAFSLRYTSVSAPDLLFFCTFGASDASSSPFSIFLFLGNL